MRVAIAGCGLSGIVSARLLAEKGHGVDIFDTRAHIGGNCYDSMINNTRVHNYGAHIFHTNDEEVWRFLNRFTVFDNYSHCVMGRLQDDKVIPIPFNDISARIVGEQSEEWIVDNIFREYTRKQWGVPYEQVTGHVTKRNSLKKRRREGDDCRYFLDKYQGIPQNGYTAMFENMLDHDNIDHYLSSEPETYRAAEPDLIVYTGKIDEYFSFCYGHLPYRSLKWWHEVVYGKEAGLSAAVINECNSWHHSTRRVDHSWFHNRQSRNETVITTEFAMEHKHGENLPIYPIPFGEGPAQYAKYRQLADHREPDVLFLGRLATYKYLDMWQAIKQVMQAVEKIPAA